MQAKSLIEKGIPTGFAALGILCLLWWGDSFLKAPPLPERPLGIEQEKSAPQTTTKPTTKSGGLATSAPVAKTPAATTKISLQTAPPVTPDATPPPAKAAAAPRVAKVAAVPALPGLWPGFRGALHNNIAPENAPLSAWGGNTPRLLWSQNLGEGYAGAAVAEGRVYLLDYDDAAQADTLRCFALSDGREVWRQSYAVEVRRNHGMSRTVPSIANGIVVTLGPKCHLMACDARSGAVLWRHDLVAEFGVTVPEWYAGECPLIDENRVILGTGGKALIIAFDLKSGRPLWQAPNPRGWKMTHSSVLPLTIAGEKQFIYCGSGGIAGVSAKNGAPLWESNAWVVSTATVPTPVDAGGGKILLSGGYNAGAMLAQITKNGGAWSFKTLWRTDSRTLGSDQQTPLIYKGNIYAVVTGGQMVCLDLQGKTLWRSGSQYRFGLGPYFAAGGKIFALSDKGLLTMIEPNPQQFRPLGQVQILDGREAWGPMALAGSRLLARDLTKLVCVELGR